jgi:hypothetical protein
VKLELDSSSDLEINTKFNKKVIIKSSPNSNTEVGNAVLILENSDPFNNGGVAPTTFQPRSRISFYNGSRSVSANEAMTITSYAFTNAPGTAYNAIESLNGKGLFVTASSAPITISTSTIGNININSSTRFNVNSNNGGEKLYVNANNHFSSHSTPISGSINDDIFLSGVYNGPVRPGSTDSMIIIWQRVGNVVRCSAKIDYFGNDGSGPNPNTSTFQLPYYTNGASYNSGTTFLYIYGHGHGINYGSNVYYVLPFGQRGGELGLFDTVPEGLGNHTIIAEFSYDLL